MLEGIAEQDGAFNDWVNAMNRIEKLEGVLQSIAGMGKNVATGNIRPLDSTDAYMARDKARSAINYKE